MKKTLLIAVSLIGLTILAGCGNKATNNWPAKVASNFLDNIHSCNWEVAYWQYANNWQELYDSMKQMADLAETSIETICKELVDDKKVGFEVKGTNFVGEEDTATEAEVVVSLTTEWEEPATEYIRTILIDGKWKVEISGLDM